MHRPSNTNATLSNCLTITLETHRVATHPSSTVRTSNDTIGTVSALAQTTSLSAGRSKTTHLAMLVDRVDDPVDTGVVTDLGVGRVYKNYFVVLHGGVLVDPVRVQYTQVGVLAADLFFGNTLQVTLELELVDTMMPEEERVEVKKETS